MLIQRRRRVSFLILLVLSIGIATTFALYALRRNVNLYETPHQVLQRSPQNEQIFRLGGLVLKGSVHHDADLKVRFTLTDYQGSIPVEYQGVLPSLFREGQGIVAQGRMNSQGIFIADEVLAKHDENYRPPQLSRPEA